MPPRSYYLEPRSSDYIAYTKAFFPDDLPESEAFSEQSQLPYILSLEHLAAYIGVAPSLISHLARKPDHHYRTFPIKKAGGKQRIINTPRTYLKVVQWWILDNILQTYPLHNEVHGFRRGRSYISNSKAHLGNSHILNVDIERFFPSITAEMIGEVFKGFGYNQTAASLLAKLTSLNNEAPTGAPTSPIIGNIVLSKFDLSMRELAASLGIVYTRYADDLTFSSESWIEVEFLKQVQALVELHGFKLNQGKSRFMGRGDRMEVTGVIINSGQNLTKQWRNRVRGILHRAELNPEDYANNKEFGLITGICGTLASVDPKRQKPLTKTAFSVLAALSKKRQSDKKVS